MGRGHPRGARSRRGGGKRREAVPAEVHLDELDAPHPLRPRVDEGGPANRKGLRLVDRAIRDAGRRLLDGRNEERRPLRRGEPRPRTRAVRIWQSSEGPERLRVARRTPRQERRLELLGGRSEPRLVGRDERLRGLSAAEVDGGDETRRRTRGRVLLAEGIAQAGRRVSTLVPLSLPGPLLLRPPRGTRFHDCARVRGRSADAARPRGPEGKTSAGRAMESRRASPGSRGEDGRMVREASEAHTDPVRARNARSAQQDDHAQGNAGPESSGRFEVAYDSERRITGPRLDQRRMI